MQQLRILLNRGLKASTFVSDASLRPSSERVTEAGAAEEITPSRYAQLCESGSWDNEDLRRARAAVLFPGGPGLTELADCIRAELGEFVDADSGRIGHAMSVGRQVACSAAGRPDGAFDVEHSSPVENFAEGLIRGAAVLGVDRVVSEVTAWRDGEPVRLRLCRVIDELTTERALEVAPGVRVETLPASSDELPAWLPMRKSPYGYLSRTVVAVEAETQPALFRPDPTRVERCRITPTANIDAICRALSLETGERLTSAVYVEDYGDLAAVSCSGHGFVFDQGDRGHVVRWGDRLHGDESGVTTLTRAPKSVSQAHLATLVTGMDGANARTMTAIERWLSAMDGQKGLANRLIDLRITLESLYVRNSRGNAGEIALGGAWYLGADDCQKRRQIYETLKKAYRLASRAVHSGHADAGEETRECLAEGLELCRRSIVKVLSCDESKSWEDVARGRGVDV